MLTEAQKQYLMEVLGTLPESYLRAAAAQTPIKSSNSQHPVVVLTPVLSPTEVQLLDRILASAKLSDVAKIQDDAAVEGILPEAVSAQQILVFTDRLPQGRSEREGSVWWVMSPLSSMLGEGPEVAQVKKAVWNQIQQFNKERLQS